MLETMLRLKHNISDQYKWVDTVHSDDDRTIEDGTYPSEN